MSDFLRDLLDPQVDIVRLSFVAGMLASVAFGVIGTYVVARRISNIAGAISHSVLGGIGAALYLRHMQGWTWCEPIYGAVAAALVSAVVIGLVSMYAHQREDAVISAIWATGMAVGLLFMAKTAAYADAMSYLFGNILLITHEDLRVVAVLDVVVVVLGLFFYNKLLAVCFDEEFAWVRGVRVRLYYLLLLCLTSLTVVLLVRVVGIVMTIALLTLPSLTAGYFSRRLWQMMVLSVFFCAIFTAMGLAVSYPRDLPTGPTIIILAAAAFLVVVCGAGLRRRLGHRGGGSGGDQPRPVA